MNCFVPKSLDEINEIFLNSNPSPDYNDDNSGFTENFDSDPVNTNILNNKVITFSSDVPHKEQLVFYESKIQENNFELNTDINIPVKPEIKETHIVPKKIQKAKKRWPSIVISAFIYLLVSLFAACISLITWSQNTDTSIAGFSFYTLSEYHDSYEYSENSLIITKTVNVQNLLDEISPGKEIVLKKHNGKYAEQIVTNIKNTEDEGNPIIISEGKDGTNKNSITASGNMIKGVVICQISSLGKFTNFLETNLLLFLFLLGSAIIVSILIQIIFFNLSLKKEEQ